MGKSEILDYLKDNLGVYMSYDELSENIGYSKQSIKKNLNSILTKVEHHIDTGKYFFKVVIGRIENYPKDENKKNYKVERIKLYMLCEK